MDTKSHGRTTGSRTLFVLLRLQNVVGCFDVKSPLKEILKQVLLTRRSGKRKLWFDYRHVVHPIVVC